MVEYVYDAWGNHAVLDANGNDLTDTSHIGNRNPFRYRGYFYDVETGLYYLQTRYYDPEIGRFLNMDDISYADPEQIHGLNLYAYCANNPVNYVDPTGHFIVSLIVSMVVGAVIGGAINGIKAYNAGQRGWGLFGAIAGGAIMGGAMGSILALGGAAGLASAGLANCVVSTGAALGISVGVGAGAGIVSYSLENGLRTDREWTVGGMFMAGFSGAAKGGLTFAVGLWGGKSGAFDCTVIKNILGKKVAQDSISYGIAKGLLSAAIPGFWRNIFTWSSFYFGDLLTKTLFVSSIASITRSLIDYLFGLLES